MKKIICIVGVLLSAGILCSCNNASVSADEIVSNNTYVDGDKNDVLVEENEIDNEIVESVSLDLSDSDLQLLGSISGYIFRVCRPLKSQEVSVSYNNAEITEIIKGKGIELFVENTVDINLDFAESAIRSRDTSVDLYKEYLTDVFMFDDAEVDAFFSSSNSSIEIYEETEMFTMGGFFSRVKEYQVFETINNEGRITSAIYEYSPVFYDETLNTTYFIYEYAGDVEIIVSPVVDSLLGYKIEEVIVSKPETKFRYSNRNYYEVDDYDWDLINSIEDFAQYCDALNSKSEIEFHFSDNDSASVLLKDLTINGSKPRINRVASIDIDDDDENELIFNVTTCVSSDKLHDSSSEFIILSKNDQNVYGNYICNGVNYVGVDGYTCFQTNGIMVYEKADSNGDSVIYEQFHINDGKVYISELYSESYTYDSLEEIYYSNGREISAAEYNSLIASNSSPELRWVYLEDLEDK